MEWEDFISSMVVDEWIVRLTVFSGIFYVLCALAVVLLNENGKYRKWIGGIIIMGSIGLIKLSLLYWLEKFQSIGQFIEYSFTIWNADIFGLASFYGIKSIWYLL